MASMLEKFNPIAETHNISLAQLAIAWTFSQPGLTHVLGGTQKAEQAIENAGAGDVRLSEAEIKIINDIIEQYQF